MMAVFSTVTLNSYMWVLQSYIFHYIHDTYTGNKSMVIIIILHSVCDCVRQKNHSCQNEPIQIKMPQ